MRVNEFQRLCVCLRVLARARTCVLPCLLPHMCVLRRACVCVRARAIRDIWQSVCHLSSMHERVESSLEPLSQRLLGIIFETPLLGAKAKVKATTKKRTHLEDDQKAESRVLGGDPTQTIQVVEPQLTTFDVNRERSIYVSSP